MQNLFRLSLCRRIVILLAIAAQIQVPLSIWEKRHEINDKNIDADQNDRFFNLKQPDEPSRRRRGGNPWLFQRRKGWGQAE